MPDRFLSTPSSQIVSNGLHRTINVSHWLLIALIFLWPFHSFSQLYISEILADNQLNSVLDEDGDHSDWFEIWNNGPAPVSLNGWYVTDDFGDLRKWRFPVTTPAVNIAAGARLIIYARIGSFSRTASTPISN
jgi:Lamin Tail Domain